MLFAKYRDWTPRFEHKGYELGFMEHDDGDVVKWDWTIYKFARLMPGKEMYEEICNLDVSPYERNTNTIRDLFQKRVRKLIDNDVK